MIPVKDTFGKVTEIPALSSFWLTSAVMFPPTSSGSSGEAPAAVTTTPVPKMAVLPYLPGRAFLTLPNLNRREYLAFISHDLSQILKMDFHTFWSQVLFDQSLVQFLDTFLKFHERSYTTGADEGGKRREVDDCAELEYEIFRRVLVVMVRLSRPKESDVDHWGREAYEQRVMKEGGVLTIPRLMDMCALFGKDNSGLVERIIKDSLDNSGTTLQQEVGQVAGKTKEILGKIEFDVASKTPHLRRELSGDTSFHAEPVKLSNGSSSSSTSPTPTSSSSSSSSVGERKKGDPMCEMKLAEVLELHHYLLDIFKTVGSLVENSPGRVSVAFGEGDFLRSGISCYNKVLPTMFGTWKGVEAQHDESQTRRFVIRHSHLRKTILDTCNVLLDRYYFEVIKSQVKAFTATVSSRRTSSQGRGPSSRSSSTSSTSSTSGSAVTSRSASDNTLLETLFGILMEALEYEADRDGEFSHGHSFFTDFEREHSLTRKLIVLKSLIRETEKEDDPRMEFVLKSLAQVAPSLNDLPPPPPPGSVPMSSSSKAATTPSSTQKVKFEFLWCVLKWPS